MGNPLVFAETAGTHTEGTALCRRLYADPKLRALKSLRFPDRPRSPLKASPAPAAKAAHINDS